MNDAPIDFTSSADAGRTSYASTTAPSRLAVAIACSPATPAPSTTTRAGGTVPAAVMNSGKNRGSRIAASNAHRYPDTSACEVNASIDCAREIRGTSSIENAVTPASRNARTPSSSADGVMNPIVTAPRRNRPDLGRQQRPHVQHDIRIGQHVAARPTSTPTSRNASSELSAAAPAPASTTTSAPDADQRRSGLGGQRDPTLTRPDLASNGDTHGRTLVVRHSFGLGVSLGVRRYQCSRGGVPHVTLGVSRHPGVLSFLLAHVNWGC